MPGLSDPVGGDAFKSASVLDAHRAYVDVTDDVSMRSILSNQKPMQKLKPNDH